MVPFLIICLVVLAVLGVGLTWTTLDWVWFQPRKLEKRLREQGLKGNPYKILYGDFTQIKALLEEANSKPISISADIVPRVLPQYLLTLQKFGKNSYLWLGPKPTVVILEPELIKEITTKIDVFRRPRVNPLARLLAEGLITYEGEKWAKHRKLVNPAFHMEKLKLMLPAFYESASEMLGKWENMVSEKGQVIEVDVWPHLQTMTSDVISRTAFGSNYEQGRRIFELQTEQVGHLMKAARSPYFPGLRFLPTKRNMRMKQIAKEVDDSVMEIINARLKSMEAGEWNGDDLLGLLLESNSQENRKHGNNKSGMSIGDVIQECKLFYFAGQETTSVLLVWTMVLLSRFQDWQSRAREEVLQIFGSAIKPDFDRLNQLKIVNMILHEALRLYPPVAFMSKRIGEETKLGNLNLPAGVLVTVPTMMVHHDPNIWGDDAKEFKPERFAEGVSHATKGQVVFLPFSWGPRICVGQNFAMLEAKLAMAMILQRFCFELSPSYSHAPRSSITLQPQHGTHLLMCRL